MKRKLVYILFLQLFINSCTSVKYTHFPTHPLAPAQKEKIVLMPFDHPDYSFSIFANEVISDRMNEIDCFEVIRFDTVSDVFYRYVIQTAAPLSEDQMIRLYEKTGIKYFFKGTFVGESKESGMYGPTLYEDTDGFYFPGQQDNGRWKQFAFEIYDLENQTIFYRLEIKVAVTSSDIQRGEGEYQKVYSPAVMVLDSKTLNKSLKRIQKAFTVAQ